MYLNSPSSSHYIIPHHPTTFPHSRALRNARLDVLVYPEVGIDPVTYYLSFARLAPVQVITTTLTEHLRPWCDECNHYLPL